MDKEYAKYLLEKTKDDYNLIAEDFSRTRYFLSDDIKNLAAYAVPGEKVLDSGCGNGRLFDALKNKNIDYFGVDISERLVAIAKERHLHPDEVGAREKFLVGDSLNLPLSPNLFGSVFSLSVLHHIPSSEFRLQYLTETKRVLKQKGILVLRVWDFWKRKGGLKLILKYGFLKLVGGTTLRQAQGCPEIYRRAKLDFGDVFLPWKNSKGESLAERYFHCFTKRELENLVKEAGFKIKKSWRAGFGKESNIYLIAAKQ
jgi:SAM-dependent methyltransferase